ncbi:hypothetical protein [Streptomyces sp. NPDC055085]
MPLKPTDVYVLLHEEAGAVKVGISRQHFSPPPPNTVCALTSARGGACTGR